MNAAQTGALRDGVLPRRWRQCLFIGLLALPGLVFLFYVVENWRGKNAWEKYKTELQAQGEKLEVKDFIPPPIPDEQNILTLPIMAGWRGQTSATGRRIQIPDSNQVDGDWGNGRFTDLLEWKAWLQKKKPAVTSSSIFPGSTKADEVVDLVSFDDTPLEEAVRVLARQAGVKIQFSPGVVGAKLQGVKISLRFEHVTARQVLLTLLDNYSLALTNVEATAGFRVINKAEVDGRFRVVSKPPEEFDYAAYGQRLATNAAPADTNEVLSEVSFKGVASLAEAIRAIARQAEINIILDPKVEADISRINLRWKNITAVQALQKLLGEHRYMLWPASTDPIVWRVVPRPARAAVVLEDFKEFADEFEELHEACRRPKERYDLDSETSFKNTIHPNFIRARTDCQALALRASAALAVNDPERATQDVFDCLRLSRVAQAHPTLIGTMIHAAIVGLVTQPIWEGVASHRWTQAQLVELQKQLSAIDLLSDMAAGLRVTRAWTGQGLENDSREELSTNYVYARDQSLSWEQFKQRWTIRLCPGGLA